MLNEGAILGLVAGSIGAMLTFFALWTIRRYPALETESKLRQQFEELQDEISQLKRERDRESMNTKAEIAKLRATVETLTEKLAADAEVKREQAARIQMLEQRLAAYTGRVNGRGRIETAPSRQFQGDLRRLMAERLHETEIKTLIADLTGDPEKVAGSNKESLILNLITYCVNRGTMADLLLTLRQARPDLELPPND